MSSVVVSFRMNSNQHQEMLAECHRQGISSTEWIQQKIAYTMAENLIKDRIIGKLNLLRRRLESIENAHEEYNRVVELLNYVLAKY